MWLSVRKSFSCLLSHRNVADLLEEMLLTASNRVDQGRGRNDEYKDLGFKHRGGSEVRMFFLICVIFMGYVLISVSLLNKHCTIDDWLVDGRS